MKNVPKIIFRLLITFILTILILLIVYFVLKIKHRSKNEEISNDWNWQIENDVIFNMHVHKYPTEDDENPLMVMRKDADIPEKQPGEKRILVVGDSYVSGYGGTNANYTWWKQLNLLIKEAGYSNVNVYGVGKYFLNTNDQLEKILENEQLIEKISPDLIIMGYVQNDPEERDETNNHNLIKEDYEVNPEEHPLYQKSPTLYYEYEDRMNSLDATKDYDQIIKMGEVLGYCRWDVRTLLIASGDRLERYKEVLKKVDQKIKSYGIPYFYYFLNNVDDPMVKAAHANVYNAMNELGIPAYYEPFSYPDFIKKYELSDSAIIGINPDDAHPGIVLSYDFGKKVYEILNKDYNFIFENPIIGNLDDLELNINDTMPYLPLDKKTKNAYEFYYPTLSTIERELIRFDEKGSYKFLYYPIEKNYIKLNLEYPKNVSKIIIRAEGLKESYVYVNTIDKDYNFDINEAYQKVTPCEKIDEETFMVNNKITSVNIALDFEKNSNRKVRIEFIEE